MIKRTASLLVVGICCNLIWRTHFLCLYSICIAIGALLLMVSYRSLWALALIFVLIWGAFTFWIFGYYDVIENFETLQNSDPWTLEGTAFRLFLYRFHSIFFWSGLLLIGMWLGRQKVHYLRVRVAFFGGIVVLVSAYAYWLIIRYVWVPSRPSLADLPSAGSVLLQFIPLDILATCGITAVIIGGSLMLTEKYPDVKWTQPFIATGQLALTLYIAHLVIGKELLEPLGVLEDKTLPFAIGSAVIFCVCAVIFSHFWKKRFSRGPLEWSMRRITG